MAAFAVQSILDSVVAVLVVNGVERGSHFFTTFLTVSADVSGFFRHDGQLEGTEEKEE